MTSYSVSENDNENIENILGSIKELVGNKLILLITIILKKDQSNWFISLKIKEEDFFNRKHYSSLVELMNKMQKFEPDSVPESLIEQFGLTLLSTPELNTQINKLVLKYFG